MDSSTSTVDFGRPDSWLHYRPATVPGLASGLLSGPHVADPKLIAVRQVRAGDRTIAVELYRNEGGSVAARCRIGEGDAPIIDGPSEEEVIAAVQDALEALLLARDRGAAR